jgi:hypothetical protein
MMLSSIACDRALISVISSNFWEQEKATRDYIEEVGRVGDDHIFG